MKRGYFLLILLATITGARAQQARPVSSGTIYHEIAQLSNLTSVLYVAAHPDDENTRLLAWLVNDRHIRAGYLSLTRGDGGQNLLGSEQGPALGLIRTHELIEARKLDGAEQYFTRAVDFGFSKTYDETFKHWPRDILAGDAVQVYRRFRPDVVICRFPPDSNAGHGQHAASAIIGEMAFRASGDKSKFPQQLKYWDVWQPRRILLNTFRFGNRNTTSEDQFKIPIGQYIPSLGMGAGELAGQSRSIHKSQGAGTSSVAGVQVEYFKLVAGDTFTTSIFDGIDITWNRVGRADIAADLKKIQDQFSFLKPDASLPALLAVRKKIQTVKDDFWREQKLKEVNAVILHCAGIMAEVTTKRPEAVRGEVLPFTLGVVARTAMPVVVTSVSWAGTDSVMSLKLGADTLYSIPHTIRIPEKAPLTQPYWLEKVAAEAGMYYMPTDTVAGLPETPPALNAQLTLTIAGEAFSMQLPLSFKKLDPVKGDVVEQLRIVPDATLEFTNGLYVANADGGITADLRIHAFRDMPSLYLSVSSDVTAGALFQVQGFAVRAGTDTVIRVSVPGSKELAAKDYHLIPMLTVPGSAAHHVIQYSHLPVLQYFSSPMVSVLQPSWKTTAKRIGYVEGAGDNVAAVLRQAGVEVDILKDADMNPANLKKYDAIVTGIRAVNAEKAMARWMPVLLQYAEQGGTLVMQYNTMQDLSTTRLGPHPFSLSAKRVTEEDATVTMPVPEHRLLNYPNKIVNTDFDGWVQERGLYFPVNWDSKYTSLFTMNDAGEQPLGGSTLYTQVGKGHYVYTSLSFSRQLPAGNKGAIKLLLNMISVGK